MFAQLALLANVTAVPPTPMPTLAKVLPQDAVFVGFVQTDSKLWQEFSRKLPPVLSPAQIFRLPPQVSFAKDIQPWLTDRVAIALFSNSEPSPDPGLDLVVLIPTKNRQRTEQILAKLGQFKSTRYQGIQILELTKRVEKCGTKKRKCQSQELDQLEKFLPYPLSLAGIDLFGIEGGEAAIAVFPDYLALAKNSQTLRKLIDSPKGTYLSQTPALQKMIQHRQWQRSLFSSYGNYAGIAKRYQAYFSSYAGGSNIPGFDSLRSGIENAVKEYSTLESHIWTTPQGFQAQSLAYYKAPIASVSSSNNDNSQILTRVPGNSYLAINSRNFKDQWQWLSQVYKSQQPILAPIIDGIESGMSEVLGLNLSADIAPWIDGEYAIALYPSDRGFLPSLGVNWGLGMIIQTSDRNRADKALTKFNLFARKLTSEDFKIVPRLAQGLPMTSWEVNKSSVFAYGWVDDNTLLVSTGIDPLTKLKPPLSQSLAKSNLFQNAIADIPKSNFGYFFINTEAWVKFGLAATSKEYITAIPKPVAQILQSLRGSTFVYSQTKDYIQTDFSLGLSLPNTLGVVRNK